MQPPTHLSTTTSTMTVTSTAATSSNPDLHLRRRLQPEICQRSWTDFESTWIVEALAMASDCGDRKKRSWAMRTEGEGVSGLPRMGTQKTNQIATNPKKREAVRPPRRKEKAFDPRWLDHFMQIDPYAVARERCGQRWNGGRCLILARLSAGSGTSPVRGTHQ